METVYFITISLLLLLCLGILGYLVYRLRSLSAENKCLSRSLNSDQISRSKLELQLKTLLNLNHAFTGARDENQIIETLLSMAMELAQASGASFVPLDEYGQPKVSVQKGYFPFPIPDAWLEYLASPSVRSKCQACSDHRSEAKDCPLMRGPFSDAMGVYCFSLRYGERELGLLNIYLPGPSELDPSSHEFIKSIVEMTTLALEGERLRLREIITLGHMNHVREKQDLESALIATLESLVQVMHADFCLLVLDFTEKTSLESRLKSRRAFYSGNFSTDRLKKAEQILSHSLRAGLTEQFSEEDTLSGKSWLGIPVTYPQQEGKCSWLLLAGPLQTRQSPRRLFVAQSVAEKLALLLQNADNQASMEYKIMMEERRRLAREIHDGLAQTLGFLKLQIAQIMGYLEREDRERANASLRTCYDALSEAYSDARLAIDGLRVTAIGDEGYNLKSWLDQTAEDYSEQQFEIKIEYDDIQHVLPPEIHIQLIRIVQEALSNIRKHAHANKVTIACAQKNHDFILEIRDDGVGFSPEDIPKPSRYGLKGMRERSGLLGADFQIISRPGEGTTIRLRIPIEEQDWMEV